MSDPYSFQGIQRPVGMTVPMPATAASPAPAPAPTQGTVVDLGLVRAGSLSHVLEQEAARRGEDAQETQSQPLVVGLAGHLRRLWDAARMAKEQTVEPRMHAALRARRGEYDPGKLAAIRAMGGSEAYAQITSVKCRAAASWLRDVLLGQGVDRPWGIKPTPMPDLPPAINEMLVNAATQKIMELQASGIQMQDTEIMDLMQQLRDEVKAKAREKACQAADRMADKMEDQLDEGGFIKGLHEFVDDLTTFPAAILKGPVLRKVKRLEWRQTMDKNYVPVVTDEIVPQWERVSPFDFYPSPEAADMDGYCFERHRLSRSALQSMIGVEGYDEGSIRLVLDEYGRGGLNMWLANDLVRAEAEGKHTTGVTQNVEGLIDALQYFGCVQGKLLLEWGMDEKTVPDELAEYDIEAWLIGPYVIKAMVNGDPLYRKPYYVTSYEKVPGSIWGNSVADLLADVQTVCNTAMRAIVNNMAIASGPQVAVNVDLLQPGENITTVTPWKIWQTKSDPQGNNASARPPVDFFQPDSNIGELNAIYEKFSQLADEYSGIPRYLTGDTTGGAGRTASGLSMLINNAGKALKQVISNVDQDVMRPALEMLYYHNMLHEDDPDLKGDVQIIASGASALVAKEAAQVRRNEVLQATANPIDLQIMGLKGRAYLLRETLRDLDLDVDKIIPPDDVLHQKIAQMMAAQMAAAAGGAPGGPAGPAAPGMPALPAPGAGQTLQNGAPVVDNFHPKPNP